MPLDKAIKHGKEKRRPYRGAKAIDHTCRNHGTCKFCMRNRLYSLRKADTRSREMMKERDDDRS